MRVSVRTPSGGIVGPRSRVMPGRYDARLPLRETGPYVMTMTAVSATSVQRAPVRGF
jgi:hypothetical protein